MPKHLKAHGIGFLYGILLTGFTVYLLMDTFLISKIYCVAEEQNTIQEEKAADDTPGTSVNIE